MFWRTPTVSNTPIIAAKQIIQIIAGFAGIEPPPHRFEVLFRLLAVVASGLTHILVNVPGLPGGIGDRPQYSFGGGIAEVDQHTPQVIRPLVVDESLNRQGFHMVAADLLLFLSDNLRGQRLGKFDGRDNLTVVGLVNLGQFLSEPLRVQYIAPTATLRVGYTDA